MICKKCNGKGYIYTNAFGTKGILRCDVCGGNGKILSNQQTNEEWLRSATTEQLADAFFEYRYTYATPRQKLWMSANEKCIKADIVEWLKQPHTTIKE